MRRAFWVIVGLVIGFILVAAWAFAAPPEGIALLDEHGIYPQPGPWDAGNRGTTYRVPPGRVAVVTGWFCELRTAGVAADVGWVQALWVIVPARTVASPETPTLGMNTVDCLNASSAVVIQTNASALTLYPGDTAHVVWQNRSTGGAFMNMGAYVMESDLAAGKAVR